MISQVVKRVFRLRQIALEEKETPIGLSEASLQRMIYFYEHVRAIQPVEGAIVECGVGWGRSLFALAVAVRTLRQNRHIFGFDSFQGFPDPLPQDLPGKARRGHYKTNRDSVVRFLANSGLSQSFISSYMTIVPGFFSDSLRKCEVKSVALLHLDVDIYSSYKEALEFFYPRVSSGGIIAFDEYQSTTKYPGAKMAVDEFFKGRREILRKSPIIDRYYTVKV